MKSDWWRFSTALVGLVAVVWAGCSSDETRVVIAAGTTLVDGGMLERVIVDYEGGHPGVQLSVVGVPTARVLALARGGSADVTITHDPEKEERFIAEGESEVAVDVFSSRFILAGPLPAAQPLRGLKAADALRRIAEEGHLFVSRADGSGTYQRERHLWNQAGLDPTGRDWYIETRQGMGLTLQVASQREAFVLAELSVFLTLEGSTGLVDAALDPTGLDNPYRAMAVKGSAVVELAADFVRWLQSGDGRESVREANQALYGFQVFQP